MPKVSVKNLAGKEVRNLDLKDSLFGLPANDTLLHQVYVAIVSNQRQVLAHTKDRGERAGSGIKPWRQKGTGRARVGSVRSPIWRKGGVTFGPTKDRNFSKDINQKMRQKAVLVALSEKVRAGKLILVDAFDFSEKKTKKFAEALTALGVAGKSMTIGYCMEERECRRLSRNISKTEDVLAENINVKQLLEKEFLLLSENGVKRLEERFAAWEKK